MADSATRHGIAAQFSIPSQSLADALDRFGEQSGLQIAYEEHELSGRISSAIAGDMSPHAALDRLLEGSGLQWSFVNDLTVVVRRRAREPASDMQREHANAARTADATVATLAVVRVTEDPRRVLPNESSDSSFGFQRSLLETPRSVSFISEETIDLFALSAVEDLVRVVPGVFTTTRFGIQGAIDIRSVPADTYFRGMKRLSLQGHGRSVLAAMDQIEIVAGPPSPIFGMGKIGGYTNLTPKSGRAQRQRRSTRSVRRRGRAHRFMACRSY